MNPYSAYDYLAFVLPGGTVLMTAIYGWYGWPWKEPGASALVGLLAASFVIGNALAGLGNFLEPAILFDRPGKRPDGLWGQFALGDRYDGQKDDFLATLRTRYGSAVSLEAGYRLAVSEVRQQGKGDVLDTITSRIGFYRGMVMGMLTAIGIEAGLAIEWHTQLPPRLWIPILGSTMVLFAYRYRHFWRLYGDYVIRGFRLLPPK